MPDPISIMISLPNVISDEIKKNTGLDDKNSAYLARYTVALLAAYATVESTPEAAHKFLMIFVSVFGQLFKPELKPGPEETCVVRTDQPCVVKQEAGNA